MSTNQFRLGDRGELQRSVVLAVDDDDDNLLLLSYALECLDCEFIGETTGSAALQVAKTRLPSLILMDVILPDANGIEVMQQLKQDPCTAHIPVIAVTGLATDEDREGFLAAGFVDYINKPYPIEELEAKVRHYLQHLCSAACS